ncbi:MAG: YdeI/OmpD-associated family protein [Ignavibacteria bacterium]|nr:YdeI/OmpD-associated family protein [Ignavibacteria bacterium]
MNKNRRIDDYIVKSENSAKPILRFLRDIVHKACPDVEETMKWGMPYFVYKGMMCGMASFKQHCTFGFWKASYMKDKNKVFVKGENSGMGNFGKIKDIQDLPSAKIIIEYVKEAMKLNDNNVVIPKELKKNVRKELVIPKYFFKALKKNEVALKTYMDFSYSHKKEYLEWITEAKKEETRDTRINIAIEWLSEGKGRNWKYEK